MSVARLAVIGVGLIGASVARAARLRGIADRVIGIDPVTGTPVEGVDERIDARDGAAVDEAVEGADLVVLAAPVHVVAEQVARVTERARLVTDCGSTKRAVMRAAARSSRRGRFVAGHPMAGAPEGGAENAREDLFDGRPWILCTEGSDADAVETVRDFVAGLGAVPVFLDAEAHDRAVAITSHAPQLVASVLLRLAAAHDALVTAGPAFERTTLGAGGPEAVWRDIYESNADRVAEALRAVAGELTRAADALAREPPDVDTVVALLAEARKLR